MLEKFERFIYQLVHEAEKFCVLSRFLGDYHFAAPFYYDKTILRNDCPG